MSQEEQEGLMSILKKITKQYEEQLGELNWRYEELKAKYEQVITPFQVKQITIVKGQELPLIIKIDPYKRSVTSLELDQKEIKK